jgi:hypothetical protein
MRIFRKILTSLCFEILTFVFTIKMSKYDIKNRNKTTCKHFCLTSPSSIEKNYYVINTSNSSQFQM